MIWVLLTVVFLMMRVAPGDPVSADVTCAEDPKARLFISKGRGAQGLDELSRDLWFRV